MLDLNLQKKRVLVTGGGRGLGADCVRAFHREGAHVIAVARSAEQLQSLANQCPGIETWAEDVTSDAFFDRMRGLDQLDVLVNNAGYNDPKPMLEADVRTLDGMLNLNVRSVYLASQAALSLMQQSGGAIVNMSSQMGHVGSPNRTIYSMTKHAVEGLTKAMAVEVAPLGIRVNSVTPTFIDTELTRPMLANPEFEQFVLGSIPMGRLGRVEDVTNAVLFLSSDLAATTTGHSMLVDGGWTAQ